MFLKHSQTQEQFHQDLAEKPQLGCVQAGLGVCMVPSATEVTAGTSAAFIRKPFGEEDEGRVVMGKKEARGTQ